MTAFDLAERLFSNAARFTVRCETVAPPPAIREIAQVISRMFAALADQEDDRELRILRRRLATLRMTTSSALLALRDPELQLAIQTTQIHDSCEMFGHDLVVLSEKLKNATDAALDIGQTPKAEALRRLLASVPGPVGILYPSRPIPGWNDALIRDLQARARSKPLKAIVSRKALLSSDLKTMITVWPFERLNFSDEAMLCYRAESIQILMYSYEHSNIPQAAPVPRVGVSARPASTAPVVDVGGTKDEDAYVEWTEPLDVGPSAALSVSDRQYFVTARYVRLGADQIVALQEDRRVLEISSLLDGGEALSRSKLPRTLPRDLSPSDLIVLRTTGTGEYLLEVAKRLIASDGRTAELADALAWKKALTMALQIHGATVVATMLRARSSVFSSHAEYLWSWTTNDVIKPMKAETFYALLEVLHELRYVDDTVIATRERTWRTMKLLVKYHVSAGQEIRRALLARLGELIEKRVVVTTTLSLELPGVDAGQLSVMRVEAVAPTTTSVPYSEIGNIHAERT